MAKPERYWSKKSPEGATYDVIVIGSGMGGMTTASMLARLGQKVLVLEQHYVPGGFTHVFSRKGFTWDVGVHAIGEVTEHAMTGRVLSWLSQGELTWSSLGSTYEHFHFPDGMTIDFPDNPTQFRQNLIDAFPDEVDAIDAYLAMVRKVAHAMKSYYMARVMPSSVGVVAEKLFARQAQKYLTMTTKEVIDGITDNPRLRAVLCGQWGYYGSVPSKSSFAMQALVAKHFMWGGYYPDGGSAEIARTLLKTVADNGGWTRLCADVEEILVENGIAVGVKVNGKELRAARIVSACGILSTVERLLPPPYKGKQQRTMVDFRRRKGAEVDWLKSKVIASYGEFASEFLACAVDRRTVCASTQLNPLSTRGHIFTIIEVATPDPAEPGTTQRGYLYVCDLVHLLA